MATATPKSSITTTKNYRLFKISEENRTLDLAKHKKLKRSMERYGFIKSFPVVCVRDKSRGLVVKDGQHRLAIAEELGLPIHYIVETVDFDVAVVNSTAKIWTVRDYAQKFASNGSQSYVEGLELAERFDLPLSISFSLLAGTTTFGNITNAFHSGDFEVKDREWAQSVASLYSAMVAKSHHIKSVRFLAACMAVCRVDGLDTGRLLKGADRCRDRLVSYSNRDAYLGMLEEIYNFGRNKIIPLKIKAIQAMRDRCAAKKLREGQ